MRILTGWVLTLTVLFLAGGLGSYFINISVGQGSLSRNLAADGVLLALVMTLLVARWKRTTAAEMPFHRYLEKVLTRSTPRSVTATPTSALTTIAITVFVLLLTFMVTPARGSELTVAQGQNGVLIIFVTLACLVGNTLVGRWRNR